MRLFLSLLVQGEVDMYYFVRQINLCSSLSSVSIWQEAPRVQTLSVTNH